MTGVLDDGGGAAIESLSGDGPGGGHARHTTVVGDHRIPPQQHHVWGLEVGAVLGW